jgi:hypothetical protein
LNVLHYKSFLNNLFPFLLCLTFSECVSVRINSLYFMEIIDWQKKKIMLNNTY